MATELTITASTAGFLSPSEIATTRFQSAVLGSASVSNISSKQFVYFATFDGTNNDQNNLALSGSLLRTNIAVLEEQVRLANKDSESNIRTGYYAGVGTGGISGGFDARTVNPTPYVIIIAEAAYAEGKMDVFGVRQQRVIDYYVRAGRTRRDEFLGGGEVIQGIVIDGREKIRCISSGFCR